MRPSGAHNPKASNKTSVKEQIRRIRYPCFFERLLSSRSDDNKEIKT